VQTRAQAELDSVLGSPDDPSFRLPTFEDRAAFPYLDALIKEALRWAPSVALGMPHATTEEDVYRGWRIPKRSIVIVHAYAMNRDEEVYPDPYKFDPERFIEKEGRLPQTDPVGTFGFGRR
jgi:cytochrome P450